MTVKTAAAGVHKTESGGVAVDLASDDAVRAAGRRIGGPLLVQPFVADLVKDRSGSWVVGIPSGQGEEYVLEDPRFF